MLKKVEINTARVDNIFFLAFFLFILEPQNLGNLTRNFHQKIWLIYVRKKIF